ncbi:helix-loop-helix DNA-binding domain-containing protein [Colletotrichum acutatum]
MSSPNKSNSPSAAADAEQPEEKPRLTEAEKKQNHIASGTSETPPFSNFMAFYTLRAHTPSQSPSLPLAHLTKSANTYCSLAEQKRRQAIREGFDRLTELVPGLEGQGRSEGLVLKKTVEFMKEQLRQRQELVERIESSGGEVDEKYKRPLFHQQANSTSNRTR